MKEEENGKDVTLHKISSEAKCMAKEMGFDGFTGSARWLARFRERSQRDCKEQIGSCGAKLPELENKLMEWVQKQQKKREAIELSAMRTQAEHIAGEMKIANFRPTFLWLTEFSSRNNIKYKTKPVKVSSKQERHRYKNEFKLTVVECAEEIGNRPAEKKYGINESLIRRWRKRKEGLKDFLEKKQVAGSSRKRVWPELDCMLMAWLQKQQEDGNMVCLSDVQAEAIRLAKLMNIQRCKGGMTWVERFVQQAQSLCVKKRASYQDNTKLSIINYAEKFGRPAASRKYGITVNHLGEWCRNKEFIRQKLECKRNKHSDPKTN